MLCVPSIIRAGFETSTPSPPSLLRLLRTRLLADATTYSRTREGSCVPIHVQKQGRGITTDCPSRPARPDLDRAPCNLTCLTSDPGRQHYPNPFLAHTQYKTTNHSLRGPYSLPSIPINYPLTLHPVCLCLPRNTAARRRNILVAGDFQMLISFVLRRLANFIPVAAVLLDTCFPQRPVGAGLHSSLPNQQTEPF